MTLILRRRTLLALGAAAAIAPAARAEADARNRLFRRGDRLFVVVVIQGVRMQALLDSAAETSMIDTRFAARLKLGGGKAETARGTGAGTEDAVLIPHVRFEAAGIAVPDATVAVLDLSDVSRRLIGGPLDMVAGREIFDSGRIRIDIARGTIDSFGKADEPKGVMLALTSDRGNELMPVTIEGTQAMATFDLGNGGPVLVSRRFAEAHLLTDKRPTGTASGGGIGGATARTTLALKSLTLAGRTFTDLPAAIDDSDTAVDANVGIGILQHFRIVTDYPHARIWLDG